MSIKIMSRVWEDETIKSTRKLLFLALADFSNDEGVCYPSQDTLVKKCGLNKATVNKYIKEFEDENILIQVKRSRKSGGRISSKYLLFPNENYHKLDEKEREIFSQSLEDKPMVQSLTSKPTNDTQSLAGKPKPSLSLFNHHSKEKNKQKRKVEPNAKRITTDQLYPKNEKEEQNTNDKNNIAILSNPSEPTSHENKKKVSTQGRKVKIDSRAICEPLNQYQLLNEIEKALFQEYFEMRELVKVKTTVGIAERLLNTYFDLGRNPKIIENAINANWRDFYPLKNFEKQKTQEQKQQEAIERVLERKRQGKGSLFGEIGL